MTVLVTYYYPGQTMIYHPYDVGAPDAPVIPSSADAKIEP